MAKITVAANRGFDMRDVDFSNLYYGSHYTRTSTLFVAHYYGGAADEFRGSGFKYNSNGEPIAGVVKSYGHTTTLGDWSSLMACNLEQRPSSTQPRRSLNRMITG